MKSDAPDNYAGAPSAADPGAPKDELLASQFQDDFDRTDLGGNWNSTSSQWKLESGQLCVRSARNHPIWLRRRLPRNARIAFNAHSKSVEGDIKAELWGNGRSYAKGASYEDATSYLLVLGGWKNSRHVLARLNEHDESRLELRLDAAATDPRHQPVVEGANYRFVVERIDGKTLVWRVNDVELFRFEDQSPLDGPQHDHFGFNDWETPVCFDNLTISPLPELPSGSH